MLDGGFIYLSFVYIPPENSSIYRFMDIPWNDIEEDVSKCSSLLGRICMFGDFNSRVGNMNDCVCEEDIDSLSNIMGDELLSHFNDYEKKNRVVLDNKVELLFWYRENKVPQSRCVPNHKNEN